MSEVNLAVECCELCYKFNMKDDERERDSARNIARETLSEIVGSDTCSDNLRMNGKLALQECRSCGYESAKISEKLKYSINRK